MERGNLPDQSVNIVRIIFLALIGGCLMFGVVSLMTQDTRSLQDNEVYLYAGAATALAGIFGAYFFTLKKTDNPQEWVRNHIVGYAMAEGGTLVNLVFFFISGNTTYMYVAVAVLLALITRYPRNPISDDGQDLRSSSTFESGKD